MSVGGRGPTARAPIAHLLDQPHHDGSEPDPLHRLELRIGAQQRITDQQQSEIDQLRQDVHLLLSEVTDSFTAISRRLDEAGGGSGGEAAADRQPVPRGWRGLGPGAARQLWRDLADWLGWLHGRYPLLGKVPPCWWRHPAAVEHLTALHHAYRAAYEDARAPAWAQAEWLDRWLPATLARLRDWLPGSCLTGTHTDDPATRYGEAVDDPVEFRARTQQDPR